MSIVRTKNAPRIVRSPLVVDDPPPRPPLSRHDVEVDALTDVLENDMSPLGQSRVADVCHYATCYLPSGEPFDRRDVINRRRQVLRIQSRMYALTNEAGIRDEAVQALRHFAADLLTLAKRLEEQPLLDGTGRRA